MSDNLPATPLADDLIDRIAREVALEVKAHIQVMYPDAARAVAWRAAALSIQGVIRNHMASAARAAEAGKIEQWLKDRRTARRRYLDGWRKAGVGVHDTTE